MKELINTSLIENKLQANILVVDDKEQNIKLIEMMLKYAGYNNVQSTMEPRQVKELYLNNNFDLILLDIRMPHLDGFQVMQQLRDCLKDDYLPILVLTAQNDMQTRLQALESGAKDFVTKPFDRVEVLNRIDNLLEVRALYNERKNMADVMEKKFLTRTRELHDTRLKIIQRLGRAGEYRDNETGMHVIRMSKSSQKLALAAGLGESYAELILNASPMHDVGKIGIADSILLKPGKLDKDEFDTMKTHAQIGADIIGNDSSDLMKMARSIAITHHEKWDGSGYPNGLKGEETPIEGRISAICDVFDALTSVRPYKKAWPVEKALSLINSESGKHFDPDLVPLFNEIFPDIITIREEYGDDKEFTSENDEMLSHNIMVSSERLEFKTSYLTGNESIDKEHKILFELINSIYDAIIDGDIKLCEDLFITFHKQTTRHFKTEELILAQSNYPDIEEHRIYHKKLLIMARETSQKCQNMSDKVNLLKCFDELIQFFIDDVVSGDLEFKSHLHNTGFAR